MGMCRQGGSERGARSIPPAPGPAALTRSLFARPFGRQLRCGYNRPTPHPASSRERALTVGGHADRRADFVTLAKENRVFRMGRFAWPFRRAKGPLLYFCRWCATICAPRGWFYQLFGQDGRYSFALPRGKNMCHGLGLRFRPRTHIYASRLEEAAWYRFSRSCPTIRDAHPAACPPA